MERDLPFSSFFLSTLANIHPLAGVEPIRVELDGFKIHFGNGETVIVYKSFSSTDKFDVRLSAQDPLKPSQIVANLTLLEAEQWLNAVAIRIQKVNLQQGRKMRLQPH